MCVITLELHLVGLASKELKVVLVPYYLLLGIYAGRTYIFMCLPLLAPAYLPQSLCFLTPTQVQLTLVLYPSPYLILLPMSQVPAFTST